MHSKQIIDVLNNEHVRKGVAQEIPLIQRLEDSSFLNNLKLTSFRTAFGLIQADYEAVAAPEIYPCTRTRLIERGTLKKAEVHGVSRKDKQKNLMDYERLVLHANNNSTIQIQLKIFKPGYKKD